MTTDITITLLPGLSDNDIKSLPHYTKTEIEETSPLGILIAEVIIVYMYYNIY